MLKKSFWFLLSILLLATIVGIIFSKEITWLLYERGNFNSQNTQDTAIILSMYLIGLIPFGLSRIFSLWLYSTHRQKEAAKISGISLGFNIILSLILVYPFQASGLALSSSLSGFVLLFLTIRAFGVEAFLDIIKNKNLIFIVIASIVLTIFSLYIKDNISVYIQ